MEMLDKCFGLETVEEIINALVSLNFLLIKDLR